MDKPALEQQVSVKDEFTGVELGDERLSRRLGKIVDALEARPDMGFPRALATEADTEGFYRFLSNPRVAVEALHRPHADATVGRIIEQGTALVVHDTTEFRFSGQVQREGLGRLTQSGQGFLGHFALAVSVDDQHDALGVVRVHAWTRTAETATAQRKKKKISYNQARTMDSEHSRWATGIEAVEQQVRGAASLIHVMDSEADDYKLLAQLVDNQRRFVLRLCYDRRLDVEQSRSSPHQKVKEFVAAEQSVCSRDVSLSRRRRQVGGGRKRTCVRGARKTTLAFSATPVVIRRPQYWGAELPATVAVNIVHVWEPSAPDDVEPVEWMLITTEPVADEEQILKVVDYYRGRWMIEQYFKALKTGCAFEKRQLESRTTLLKTLAIFIPIAWNLLRLRTLSRDDADAPATTVLTERQIHVLRRAHTKPLSSKLCVRDAMLAIARLGGHLRQNGDPGWQVLGRGFTELITLEAGYKLALADL